MAGTFAIPNAMTMTSGIARICSASMPIIRSVRSALTGCPSADRKTPEMSAQTPSRRRAVRSCSSAASYSVDSPGPQKPTPATALVTRGS